MGDIHHIEVDTVYLFEGKNPGVAEIMLREDSMTAISVGVGSKVLVKNPETEKELYCTVAFPDKKTIEKHDRGACIFLEKGVIKKLGLEKKAGGGYSGVWIFPRVSGLRAALI